MKFQKVADFALPAYAIVDGGDRDVNWSPYPNPKQGPNAIKLARLPQVRQAMADLSLIMMRFHESFQGEEPRNNLARFEEIGLLHEDLQKWLGSWPSASKIKRENEATPQILVPR